VRKGKLGADEDGMTAQIASACARPAKPSSPTRSHAAHSTKAARSHDESVCRRLALRLRPGRLSPGSDQLARLRGVGAAEMLPSVTTIRLIPISTMVASNCWRDARRVKLRLATERQGYLSTR
jgi:hypothetical protein